MALPVDAAVSSDGEQPGCQTNGRSGELRQIAEDLHERLLCYFICLDGVVQIASAQ